MPFDFDEPDDQNPDLGPDPPRDPSEDLGPEIPSVPDYSRRDVDTELKKAFWSLVLIFNVALLAVSLGLMLIGFEGRWQLGGGLVVVGVAAFVRGYYRYRKATQ